MDLFLVVHIDDRIIYAEQQVQNFKQPKVHNMQRSIPYFDLLWQTLYETTEPSRQILYWKNLKDEKCYKDTVKIYASRCVFYACFYRILKWMHHWIKIALIWIWVGFFVKRWNWIRTTHPGIFVKRNILHCIFFSLSDS